jgi:predicted nucleotidyltransferase
MDMGIAAEDLDIASRIAARLVGVGEGRVRRVAMIGSRALGLARPGSDLDIVALLEVPATAQPWNTPQTRLEQDRMRAELPPAPYRIDLSVRTTDQYEESRRVIGGVEHLVDVQGFTLFTHPLDRPPRVRRTREQVIQQQMRAWIGQAYAAFRASRPNLRAGPSEPVWSPSRQEPVAALDSVHRSLNVPFVKHQILVQKRDSLTAKLDWLSAVEPDLSSKLRAAIAPERVSARVAQLVLYETTRWAMRDPALAPHLTELLQGLSQPLLYVD